MQVIWELLLTVCLYSECKTQSVQLFDYEYQCEHMKELVEEIFNEYFDPSSSNINIVKKHLKVVLLDLYVAWNKDPMLEIGVHMSPNDYSDGTVFSKGKSRYNQLHIKRTIINVIHTLRDKGLIGFYKGTEANQKVSRIWTSPSLEGYFKKMKVEVFDILQQQQEVIILRDKDKVDIEYEDTDQTNEMRLVLLDYNYLTSPNKLMEYSQMYFEKELIKIEITDLKSFTFKNE